jgi:isopentenyldiphosphate isomerase
MAADPANELVDILDADGRPVRVATRGEMRRRRLPHRAVYVLVFNHHGELFIHQRTATKDIWPSRWDVAVGGVPAAGESFDDAARRETAEELGVEVEPVPLFAIHHADAASIVFGMVYRAVHDGPFRLQPEEIIGGEFVSLAVVRSRSECQQFCPDGLAVLERFLRRSRL